MDTATQTTAAGLCWDLTSYFPEFNGAAMQDSLRQVRAACVASQVALYCTMRPTDWRELYDLGVRSSSVTAHTATFIDELRRVAGRTMPW